MDEVNSRGFMFVCIDNNLSIPSTDSITYIVYN